MLCGTGGVGRGSGCLEYVGFYLKDKQANWDGGILRNTQGSGFILHLSLCVLWVLTVL